MIFNMTGAGNVVSWLLMYYESCRHILANLWCGRQNLSNLHAAVYQIEIPDGEYGASHPEHATAE